MKVASWFLIIIGFTVLGAVMFFGFDAIGTEYAKVANQASLITDNVITQYISEKVNKPK